MFIGVVGKPNVGKSTFFKASTLAEVEIANYPFATVKPNSGVGYVKIKDPAIDFGKRSNPRNGYVLGDSRFVAVQMIDVAGLVPGAHEGKGMGNQFLDDLRQADVLIHVIDVSGSVNEKGEPVEIGSYDPANDIKFLEEELDMWYLGIVKKGWEKFIRQVMQEKKKIIESLAKQLSGLRVNEEIVGNVIDKLKLDINTPGNWDLAKLCVELRKITKPMIIACNKLDMPGAKEKFEKLKKEFPDQILIGCSSESELALREAAKHELIEYIPGEKEFTIKKEMNEKQKNALEFIKKSMIELGTGVQEVINMAVFELLEYIALFPGGVSKLEDQHGNVIPDCFLMPKGTTALDFAYKLHSDFGDNFIKAIDVKTKRTVGKEHILNHMDIIEICARN